MASRQQIVYLSIQHNVGCSLQFERKSRFVWMKTLDENQNSQHIISSSASEPVLTYFFERIVFLVDIFLKHVNS